MRFTIILTILLSFTVLSCVDNVLDDMTTPKESIRDSFIGDASHSAEQKSRYLSLSDDNKKAVWIDKLKHLSSQNLPVEHETLILDLINAVSSNKTVFSRTQLISQIGLELARITPEDDFLKMFSSLDNFQFSGAFSSEGKCINCITDLELALATPDVKPSANSSAKARSCNCRWTCSFWETVSGTDSTSNCEETEDGCGFLFLYECDERVEP